MRSLLASLVTQPRSITAEARESYSGELKRRLSCPHCGSGKSSQYQQSWILGWKVSGPGQENGPFQEHTLKYLDSCSGIKHIPMPSEWESLGG